MPAAGLLLGTPFVSVATFKAHPTYLDLQNLRSGDTTQSDQDAALYDILLEASGWAEDYCAIPLHAHIRTDNVRLRPDRWGRLSIYPDEPPVRRVMSIATSVLPGSYTTTLNPMCAIEDGRQIITQLAGQNTSWSGALQLGTPPPGAELFVQTTYVGGYTATALASPAAAGASALTVVDPTGTYPGDTLRIWDPGKDETVYVASTYTYVETYPPPVTAVALASPLQFEHDPGVTVSGLPPGVHLAIMHKAVDLLQRPGTSSTSWPGARVKSATMGKTMGANSAHEAKAMRILDRYQDVR